MERNNEIIKKYLYRFSGSPWRFNLVMLKNIDKWKGLTMDELFDLLVDIRDEIACHYALVPFFANYLEIDIRPMYESLKDVTGWSYEEYVRTLSIFPAVFSLHNTSSLSSLGFEDVSPKLKEVKKRLNLSI
ncbi:hypothetical protein CEQ90_13330 [Lewinellaceae bacterium SD302]|nr:hypothetical protein CEQ90_13330 [Lewinellaceae bacterium SD302]